MATNKPPEVILSGVITALERRSGEDGLQTRGVDVRQAKSGMDGVILDGP